jgi:hypothetical protein
MSNQLQRFEEIVKAKDAQITNQVEVINAFVDERAKILTLCETTLSDDDADPYVLAQAILDVQSATTNRGDQT